MRRLPLRTLLAAGLCAGSLLLPASALAQTSATPASIPSCQYATDNTHSLPFCGTGQTSAVTVGQNATVTYSFNYPGDNSNITFTATLSSVDATTTTAAGFNVFDTASKANPPVPVEIATLASNGVSTDPHTMQFNYSSGQPGPVTLQLFNYTGGSLTFNISDSGFVLNTGQGTQTTPVNLTLGPTPSSTSLAAPTASSAPAPAPAAPAVPAAKPSTGTPATIASCQYTTDTTHSFPFCSTGQTTSVTVASNANVTYKFSYPGDNSNITFTSNITPVDSTATAAVGFNVFDTTTNNKPPTPVEVATIASNELNSDPHMLQFNYSSGTLGQVTVQLFNYTPNTVTFSLSDSGFIANASAGSVTTPVTLTLA